ncbi:MAG: aspartate aminotransferase family protein [Oligosphaeraceae bacterium]
MTPSSEEIRALYRDAMVPTYNFSAPIMVRGEGSRLWDLEGREYLDFTTGISVCSLGHCHPRVSQAIARQAATLMHCSNIFCNLNAPRLAMRLSQKGIQGKVFFANSGAEANEGMIKTARLWGSCHGGRHEIIVFRTSFHGRTLATLAATGQPVFRQGMEPDMPGFVTVPYNDLDAVAQAVTPRTCAVLLEPVQAEGGVYPATPEFLQGLRRLCDQKELLLLLDEVQTGMGRTGSFFCFQQYGVRPDAFSTAKALGNGIPLACFQLSQELARLHQPGLTHGSTFGGNPLATAAGLAVLDAFEEENILENVRIQSAALRNGLEELRKRHPAVKEVRGLGLLLGIQLDEALPDTAAKCREKGLLTLTAGKGVMRLLPSLKITSQEVQTALAILDEALP